MSSCSICSSNNEGSTTAAMPACSRARSESIRAVSGPDEATSGLRSRSPRYVVDRSKSGMTIDPAVTLAPPRWRRPRGRRPPQVRAARCVRPRRAVRNNASARRRRPGPRPSGGVPARGRSVPAWRIVPPGAQRLRAPGGTIRHAGTLRPRAGTPPDGLGPGRRRRALALLRTARRGRTQRAARTWGGRRPRGRRHRGGANVTAGSIVIPDFDLSTTYLGLRLRSPLVASSGPLTARIDSLRALEQAGIAAVVLPSLFEEQIEHEDM